MRISVFGCGYPGAVHAAVLAEFGHEVIGIDPDPVTVRALTRATARPDHAGAPEPGLAELLERGLRRGRLAFDTRPSAARGAAVHVVAVPAEERADGSAGLSGVEAAVSALLGLLRPGDVVVGKTAVPVGTAARFAGAVEARGASLIWSPDFLRQGFAVQDALHPERLVHGARPGDDAVAVLDVVYERIVEAGTPRIVTDYATAELVKVASDAVLAAKRTLMRSMTEVAEANGADLATLAETLGRAA